MSSPGEIVVIEARMPITIGRPSRRDRPKDGPIEDSVLPLLLPKRLLVIVELNGKQFLDKVIVLKYVVREENSQQIHHGIAVEFPRATIKLLVYLSFWPNLDQRKKLDLLSQGLFGLTLSFLYRSFPSQGYCGK